MIGYWLRFGLGVATFAAVTVAVFASLGARATRLWEQDSGGYGWTEGIDRWGVILFLAAMAFVVLLVACLWPERPRWWLLLPPAAGFAWAAWGGYAEWQALLDERTLPRDYRLVVPAELPATIVACALAAGLTVLFVAVNTLDRRRRDHQHSR